MKSANPKLTPQQTREVIVSTACMKDGFRVLNAEAAVEKAIRLKSDPPAILH
jgi:hypothetical protein